MRGLDVMLLWFLIPTNDTRGTCYHRSQHMDGIGRRYSVWNVITTTKVVMSHALSEMDDKIDGGYLAIRTTEVCQCNEYKYDLEIISMKSRFLQNATHFNIHHLHTHTHFDSMKIIITLISRRLIQSERNDVHNKTAELQNIRVTTHECKCISFHRPLESLFHSLFRIPRKKISKLCTVRGIHQRPEHSSHKWPVLYKMPSCQHVIMISLSMWWDIYKKHSHLLSIYLFIIGMTISRILFCEVKYDITINISSSLRFISHVWTVRVVNPS